MSPFILIDFRICRSVYVQFYGKILEKNINYSKNSYNDFIWKKSLKRIVLYWALLSRQSLLKKNNNKKTTTLEWVQLTEKKKQFSCQNIFWNVFSFLKNLVMCSVFTTDLPMSSIVRTSLWMNLIVIIALGLRTIQRKILE